VETKLNYDGVLQNDLFKTEKRFAGQKHYVCMMNMYRIPIITCTLYIPIQPAIERSSAQSMLSFRSKILNYVQFEWEDGSSVVPEQLHIRAGSLLA
jgi:hypothetical protein